MDELERPGLLAVAVWFGPVRLIDNVVLRPLPRRLCLWLARLGFRSAALRRCASSAHGPRLLSGWLGRHDGHEVEAGVTDDARSEPADAARRRSRRPRPTVARARINVTFASPSPIWRWIDPKIRACVATASGASRRERSDRSRRPRKKSSSTIGASTTATRATARNSVTWFGAVLDGVGVRAERQPDGLEQDRHDHFGEGRREPRAEPESEVDPAHAQAEVRPRADRCRACGSRASTTRRGRRTAASPRRGTRSRRAGAARRAPPTPRGWRRTPR